MAQEIERKFLVQGDFKKNATSVIHIQQGYIINGLVSMRIRVLKDRGYITIKGPGNESGTTRYEWERELSLDKALSLFELCGTHSINKHRYLVPVGKHIFEVDEFHDANEGLIIAEVELNSEFESFNKPEFLGKEVTGDNKYYNASLINLPYNKW